MIHFTYTITHTHTDTRPLTPAGSKKVKHILGYFLIFAVSAFRSDSPIEPYVAFVFRRLQFHRTYCPLVTRQAPVIFKPMVTGHKCHLCYCWWLSTRRCRAMSRHNSKTSLLACQRSATSLHPVIYHIFKERNETRSAIWVFLRNPVSVLKGNRKQIYWIRVIAYYVRINNIVVNFVHQITFIVVM